MTPDDYLQVLESTDLKDNEKLPHTIMSHWKIVNDQSHFSKRVQQGKEVHGNNETIKFMKENYRKICETRPKKEPSTDGPPEMVPETTWIDVASENEITKTLQCLNLNAVKHFCKQNPSTVGNTDSDQMIEKLNKLADMPESFSFSFQSHNSFMT